MKVKAKIQRWGNSLALRISGIMRDVPHFEEGTLVNIDVSEKGLIITRITPRKKSNLPFTEAELLSNITAELAHADELAIPSKTEIEN